MKKVFLSTVSHFYKNIYHNFSALLESDDDVLYYTYSEGRLYEYCRNFMQISDSKQIVFSKFYTFKDISDYWRSVLRHYCPCESITRRYWWYKIGYNPHAKNFLRINQLDNIPLFPLIFLLMGCKNIIPVQHITSDGEILTVYQPCGKCYACQSNNRGQFAFRCRSELEDTHSSYFVSLTYEDKFLPHRMSKTKLREVEYQNSLLLKRDRDYSYYLLDRDHLRKCMRNFKNFLKKQNLPIPRFVAVGEYGDQHNRPHYHILYFMREYIRKDIFLNWLSKFWKYGSVELDDSNDRRINYIGHHFVRSCSGSDYQKTYSPRFMICSTFQGGIGYNLKLKPFIQHLWNIGQKYISIGKYKYYFPRYLSKHFHPDCLTDDEWRDLSIRSTETFRQFAVSEGFTGNIENNNDVYIYYKSIMQKKDYEKRQHYEKSRILRKFKIRNKRIVNININSNNL